MTEENKRTEETKTIDTVYVTFKAMSAKKKCMTAFSDCDILVEEDPSEADKKFFEEWLDMEEALPPGGMQWLNIKYSWCNRLTRSIIIWILAWIIIIGGFLLMIYFKDINDAMVLEASLNVKCPSKLPSINRVYQDYELAPK